MAKNSMPQLSPSFFSDKIIQIERKMKSSRQLTFYTHSPRKLTRH
jgi:hypothetical protein